MIQVVKNLTYVQIDAIYVTARSHDLVMHNRLSNYKEEQIWELIKTGEAFEGFAHARGIIPIEHYPYYYVEMLRRREKKPSQWVKEIAKDKSWQREVLLQVENKGAVNVKDIEAPEGYPKNANWSNARKKMLDFLYLRGYLSTLRDDKFQIYYDLPERVISNFDKIVSDLPDREEEFIFHVKNTLESVGPASIHRLLHYKYIFSRFKHNGKTFTPRSLIMKYAKEGMLETIKIRETQELLYCLPEQFLQIEDIPSQEGVPLKVKLLSPFDNVLWSRESLEAQYGFYYRLECYVPSDKRIYGYFVMPILYGIDFVGRVDPALDRKENVFQFKQWTWEKGFNPKKHFFEELGDAITKLVKFHKVTKISLGDMKTSFRAKLIKELNSEMKIIDK